MAHDLQPQGQPTGWLPTAQRACCQAMTADGTRHTFETTALLLRWSARTADVVAICLDSCAWREFQDYKALVNAGMQPTEAFERTPLFEGVRPQGSRMARSLRPNPWSEVPLRSSRRA